MRRHEVIRKPVVFHSGDMGQVKQDLRIPADGPGKENKTSHQREADEKRTPGYTIKPALDSYTLLPSGRCRLVPHACWNYR